MAVVWVRVFFYFGVKNQPDYKNWARKNPSKFIFTICKKVHYYFNMIQLYNKNIIFRNIAENVEVEIELVFFWP